MTFVHWIITYLMEYWHEFARTVHLETKKGKSGFWHSLNTWLVAIPVGGILMVMSLVMLVAAMMFVVPIAKLVGYDLGEKFAKLQAKWLDKVKPSMWIPFTAKLHSDHQKWTSVSAAEVVFGDVVKSVKRLAETSKGAVDVVAVNKKDMSVKVHIFSPKMKWLDIMEVIVRADEAEGGTVVDACSGSAGAGPLSLLPPFGFLMSMVFFWLPYPDHGSNKKRLDDLRSSMHTEVRLAPAAGGSEKGKSE